MIKHALLALAASLGVCFSSSAQVATTSDGSLSLCQLTPAEMVASRASLGMTGSFRSLDNAWYGRGPLTISDGRLFSFPGTFGWVEGTPGDFLPHFSPEAVLSVTPESTLARGSGPKPLDLLRKVDYAGGEVGFFFGKSLGGKYSRQVEAGYILGQIIEGNTQITVGASYGHESGKVPRVIGR
ncbi:MAG TPA: hypothetical protein VGL24_12855 [Chthoniobacterales bacterium]